MARAKFECARVNILSQRVAEDTNHFAIDVSKSHPAFQIVGRADISIARTVESMCPWIYRYSVGTCSL